MSENVADAVRDLLNDVDADDRPSALEQWAREERSALWADLQTAIRSALNGQWSMGAEDITRRLVEVTLLVGPEPWRSVDIGLLESGVWQDFHAALGIEVEPPDMRRVAEVREACQ